MSRIVIDLDTRGTVVVEPFEEHKPGRNQHLVKISTLSPETVYTITELQFLIGALQGILESRKEDRKRFLGLA